MSTKKRIRLTKNKLTEIKIQKIYSLKNKLENFLKSDAYQQNTFYQELPVFRLIPKFKKKESCSIPNYLYEFVAQYIIRYRMDKDIFHKERENNILYADCIKESLRSVVLKYSYKFLIADRISASSHKTNVYIIKENGDYYIEYIESDAKENNLGILITEEFLAVSSQDDILLHTKDSHEYGIIQNNHFHLSSIISNAMKKKGGKQLTSKELSNLKKENNILKTKLEGKLLTYNYTSLLELCSTTHCSTINISLKPNNVISKEKFDKLIEKLTRGLSNKSCTIKVIPYVDIKKHFCSCCNEFIFLNSKSTQKCTCGVLLNYDKNTANKLSKFGRYKYLVGNKLCPTRYFLSFSPYNI